MKSRDIKHYIINAFIFTVMILAYSAEVILAEWIFIGIASLELGLATVVLIMNPTKLIDEMNKYRHKYFNPIFNASLLIYLVLVGATTPLVIWIVVILIKTIIRERGEMI